MPERITTEGLLAALIEQQSRELLFALPGRIESYDAGKQRASIRLQLQYYVPDGLGGRVAKEHPVLSNVPIAFPQGGGFFCSFPLAQGDPVTVVFCDVPIGAWLQKGSVCEPGAEDRHTTAGAIALPAGPQPSKSPLQSADASNMMLGKDGTGAAQIELTPTEIHLGRGATEALAIASKVRADLSALMAAVSACVTPTPGGGAALKAAIVALNTPNPWPQSYAASNAKAKP